MPSAVLDDVNLAMDAFRTEFTGNMADFHSRTESKISELEANVEREMSKSRTELQNAIAQLGRGLAELQGASAKHMFLLQSLGQQTGIGFSSPELRVPPAPTVEEHVASTPSASSAISNISSTSSGIQFGHLSLNSPVTRTAPSFPIVGPSGQNRDCSLVQGISILILILIITLSVFPSTWANCSHWVRSRGRRFNAPF